MKIFIFIFILFSTAQAKTFSTEGSITFISLTKRLSPYSSLTFYHYDVTSFEKEKFEGKTYSAGLIQSYFQTAYTYQYLPNINFSVGHIFQRNEPLKDSFQNENRAFEQLVIGREHRSFSSSHRFRFEQRFIDDRKKDATFMRTRLRYQIGARIPLRGTKIEAGEYYLNTYNEFYFSTTGQRYALYSDDWFYFGLGFKTKGSGTFEIGPLIQASVVNRDKDLHFHETIQAGWATIF